VTEFLLGHPKDRVRADRVLNALEQVDATPQLARRAAWLLARAARGLELIPSVSDGMVAALGEIYGAVATHDDKDLRALASAGTGFDVYGVREMLDVMGGQRR
jgi:predicted nucleic acid-binding protein